ncbi:hypothetical protein BDW71DRAFT_216426 [Aspergillus fruticulosus]
MDSQTLEPPHSIFDKRQKWLIVVIVSTAATFSGFASNIYFPALPTIANDLNISLELVNLSVTAYLIFQGLAPSLWDPVSGVKGRRTAYIRTFIVFVGACIGLAETKNYATIIVLRCLQSTCSTSTIAIGSGVISDIITRAERGGYMGIFQAGLLVPVAVGPVIGGAIAGSLGWKVIFWFLTVYGGVFLCLLILLLPETSRSKVANGSRTPAGPVTKYPLPIYQRTTKVKWQQTADSQPAGAKKIDSSSRYGLSEDQIGLTFIANGLGSMVGTLITGKILDVDYRRVKAKYDASFESDPQQTTSQPPSQPPSQSEREENFPLEKVRLRLIPIFSLAKCLSIIRFGWTIQYANKVHIAIPIVSTFITGWTAVSTQSLIMTYLVDLFPDRSAAASAGLNLARCLFAAGGTSFVKPVIDGVGVGVAFTTCVAVQAVPLVGPWIQCTLAAGWIRKHRERAQAKADVKQ